MDSAWWKKEDVLVQVMELFYNVMRGTDSTAKGMMGQLYDNMLQLTEELDKLLDGRECKLSRADKEKVREHLRRRWDESLACPLHVAGRILNPANQEEGIFLWKRRVDVGGPGDPSTGVVVHPEAEGRHECIRPRWCKVSLVRADARAADTAVATAAAVAAAAAAAAGVVLGTSSCSSSQQKFFFFQSPFLKAGREAHDGACRRIGACRYRVG
ncbi:unnamed protein product [Closterium sp. NIES-54]